MRTVLTLIAVLSLPVLARNVRADGCYMCAASNTYVKYSGEDTQDKRKRAEACGCKIQGTTASCYAANYTVLCSVARLPELPLMSRR